MAALLFLALWVVAPVGLARSGAFPRSRPPDDAVSCGRVGRSRSACYRAHGDGRADAGPPVLGEPASAHVNGGGGGI